MSKRFLAVLLSLVMTLGLLPCSGTEAVVPPYEGTDTDGDYIPSQGAAPTLLDTGRGYILYYFYTPDIYFSPDGVAWTNLSGRQWVQEAKDYCGMNIMGGYREFQIFWTGTEYMMRQALRDDPRPTHQRLGDSPQNSLVTFLDEDFQIIGELPFDAAVDDIRCENGTYYATAGGVETAFTREEWMAGKLKEVYALAPDTEFTDVADTDWFAPYVDVCVDAGLMVGVGGGLFAPEKTLSREECITLAARLHQMGQGGDGNLEMPVGGHTYAVLSDEQTGEFLSGNYLDRKEPTVGELCWRLGWLHFGELHGLGVDPQDEEERAWAQERDGTRAVVSLNGIDYPGYLYDSHGVVHFVPDQGSDFAAVEALEWIQEDWFMAVWYYAQQNRLGSLLLGGDTRQDFAVRMAAVTDLPAINHIGRVPDSDYPAVTELYRAGVLNGVDDKGTFSPDSTMTRAEAAAICARILKPELRLNVSLPEPGGYTLTDLGETPQGMEWRGYYRYLGQGFVAFRPSLWSDWTLETKDGRQLVLDGHPVQNEGGLLVLRQRSKYDTVDMKTLSDEALAAMPPSQYGVLDTKTLEMVVPYGPYTYCAVEEDGLHQDGFHAITNDPAKDYRTYLVWDDPDHPAELESNADEWRRTFACGLRRTWSFEDNLYGYVDKSAQFVIPPQWSKAEYFRDGYAAVAVVQGERTLWGVIDAQGNAVVPPRYTHMQNYGQGMFSYYNTEEDQGLVFAGAESPVELPLEGGSITSPFQNGYAVYQAWDGTGFYYIDLSGKKIGSGFDAAGPADADGTAFVGLGGHILRIQLER